MNSNDKVDWWKTATIYQIYPKSFLDTTGKGTGDINGVTNKLDYLKGLGIDAIWLTPIYASPMVDNGYDISDYYAINPEFGNMSDFGRLIKEAHNLGIRVVMDIVVNHTSTEHEWFKSALGDKSSPYRDYYIWKEGKNGAEPNNWRSKFGGSAWKLDNATSEYYLHLFAEQQADLNWENPKVREEVKQIISFWAEKGVDGFRLDVINLISKQPCFSDDEFGDGRRFYTDGPRVHEFLKEISKDVFQKFGSVTVGEMSSTTLAHCKKYSAANGEELSMVFNFHHLKVDYPEGKKWQLGSFDFLELKRLFNHWQSGLHNTGWGALFWCNHDQPRIVSRFGDDKNYRVESAKMLAASMQLMQGTPYIYQGEEIGMTNAHFNELGQYRDIESVTMYHELMEKERASIEDVIDVLKHRSRDNARTPMQWSADYQGGFTSGTPWIEISNNYSTINVEQALADPDSVLHFYRRLIALRKNYDVVTTGRYVDLYPLHTHVHGYLRENENQRLLCLNNYFPIEVTIDVPQKFVGQGLDVLLTNYESPKLLRLEKTMTLKPYQTLILFNSSHGVVESSSSREIEWMI